MLCFFLLLFDGIEQLLGIVLAHALIVLLLSFLLLLLMGWIPVRVLLVFLFVRLGLSFARRLLLLFLLLTLAQFKVVTGVGMTGITA